MIEYIVAENPDTRIIRKAARILEEGGLIVSPTDTSWSVLCSIASRDGVAALKKLLAFSRKNDTSGQARPPTVICSSLSEISALCELGTVAFRLIKRLTPGPYVFVLPSSIKAQKDFDLRRAELGVRIPNHRVPQELVTTLGLPVLSVTAKKTMLDPEMEADFPEELLFSAGWEMEDIPGVDAILDPGEENERHLATVLDLRSGEVEVLRMGAGAYSA